MLSRLLIASSSADNLTAIESRIRELGGSDLFLSRGTPKQHISALTARSPRAVLLAPSSASEAFQYLLLKRSITGKARSIPTLVVVQPEEKEDYHSLVSVGEFELLSLNLPDEVFTEVLVRTLRYFDSHLELAKTKASLRDSQLELKGVINTLTDGVIVTNPQGVIQRTNPAMCSLLGLQQRDIVNQPFERLIGEHEVIRMTGLGPLFKENAAITGMTVTFRRRDGSFLPLSLSGKSLNSSLEEIQGYILVARDVRDTLFLMQNESRDAAKVRQEHQELQKETDEKLAKVHNILSHSERLSQIGQLVAGIGHEINSPLHLIQLSLQEVGTHSEKLSSLLHALFEPDPTMSPEEVQELESVTGELSGIFESLKASVDMANAGAERLINVSGALRVQARRDDAFQEALNINSLIEQSLTLLRYRLLQVDLELELRDIPLVAGFHTHLTQVFTNILVNACDALEDKQKNETSDFTPTILVETACENDMVIIAFSDNGPGVPDDLRSKVFDDFFTTKAAGKGTGIGLALSRKFVDDHGGEIEISGSEKLGGARFQISLPLAGNSSLGVPSVSALTSKSELD
ncbi:MAG: ATP-binding protein [Myxococcota bacterium]|nr:ATP-binding protein [Myxococcota bacterium]